MRIPTLVAVVAAALAVGGCAATGPSSEPTAGPDTTSATPSASRSPVAAPSAAATRRPPRPAVPADLRRAGSAFVAFARGDRREPPADTPIELLLGSRRLATVEGARIAVRSAWRLCPPEGYYAARTCPFSALDVLRRHRGGIRMTTEPPEHPCMARADVPYRGRWLTLVPAGHADCVAWFAVVLAANDVGQVTAVDLVIAEP